MIYNSNNIIKKITLVFIIIFILIMPITQNSLGNKIVEENKEFNNIDIKSKQTKTLDYYNYLIITNESLEESAVFFKNWKELLGFSVKIVNTSWIYSNYNGFDQQEKIRNFLIDKYLIWGIEYLLIIGSNELIPMRNFNHIVNFFS